MLSTVALLFDEKAITVWEDVQKVAVFVGTSAGFQFVAVFKYRLTVEPPRSSLPRRRGR